MPNAAVLCSLWQDFKGLSVDKLEKYFLLLAALDENLAEYKDIKSDLDQVKCASTCSISQC